MISYLGSLVQFSPATGRMGRCRQISLCVESTHRVPATLFAPYRGVCAFPVCTAQAPGCSIWSRPCNECGSSFRVLHNSEDSVVPAFCAFPGLSGRAAGGLGALSSGAARLFPPRPERPRQPEAWAHSPRVRRAFSLRGPSACCWWGLRKSSDRNRGPVCRVGGGWLLSICHLFVIFYVFIFVTCI